MLTRAESRRNFGQGDDPDVERVAVEEHRACVDLDRDRPNVLERIPVHPPSVVPKGFSTYEIDDPARGDRLTGRNGPATARAREQACRLRPRARGGCEHSNPTEC